MNHGKKQAAIVGGMISIVGLVTGGWVWKTSSGSGYHLFPVYGAISGFLTGCLIWSIATRGSKRVTLVRGGLSGVMASLISFWLANYLVIAHANLSHHVTGDQAWLSTLGQPPVGLIQGLGGAAVLGLAGLFLFGWIPVFVSALIGGGAAWYFKRHQPAGAAQQAAAADASRG